MTSDLRTVSDFLLNLYLAAQQHAPDQFQRETLLSLQRFLPFDFAGWGGGTQESRKVTDVTMLHQSPDFFSEWEKVAHRDEYCDLALARLNRTVLFDDVPEFRRSFAYNEHWRLFDVRNMIATIMLEPVDGYVTFMGLCASDPLQRYTEEHRALKQLLMPHVCSALRLNRRSVLDRIDAPGDGIAVVDRAGRVLASRPPFWSIVREEWAGARTSIPLAVEREPHATAWSWRGNAIQLHAQPLGHHHVLRASLRSPLECLTAREAEIIEHVVRGNSHKEVARLLELAPATVRNHLAKVHDKLGISTRAELVRACMADRPSPRRRRAGR